MKKQVELTLEQAKSMLGKNEAFDTLIRANFTDAELSMKMSDRIKVLQDALNYNGKTLERFNWETERDTDQQKATKELEEICLAMREGKELGMNDRWYYPWMSKPKAGSGSGFSFGDYFCGFDGAVVGARLSVFTSEDAIYIGKQFPEILTRHLSPKA